VKFVLAVIGLFCVAATQASAGTVFFSITGDDAASPGTFIPGTITGRILGLADDGINLSPSSIIIDTAPAIYSLIIGSDPMSNDFWTSRSPNGFGMSGGELTYANFGASKNGLPIFAFVLHSNTNGDAGGASGIQFNDGEVFRSTMGLNATFSSDAAEAPEPATFGIGLGMVGLGILARRRRSRQQSS